VQIQVLRQQATPSNYDVIRLETELKGLKDKLRTSEAQWDQVCAGDVCLPSSKVPALGLEYIRLYREAKFQEGLYQLFTKMAEIARLDMVKDVTVIQVLDRAKPPERRSNKRVIPTCRLHRLHNDDSRCLWEGTLAEGQNNGRRLQPHCPNNYLSQAMERLCQETIVNH